MKVLVISDIHDHVWNLQKLIDAQKGKVDSCIACGDYCAPFIGSYLKEFDVPIYACLGNNDEDHIGLFKMAGSKVTWFHLSQEYGTVELDGRKIAFCHYPKLGELLAGTGIYDVVFHGHTHVAHNDVVGKCQFVNPGSVCGIVNGKPSVASYGIYDTNAHIVEIVQL